MAGGGRRLCLTLAEIGLSTPAVEDVTIPFWGRDAGLRIDHLLLSPSIAPDLINAGVDREVRGWEKASDHAPTWIELGKGSGKSMKRRSQLVLEA